MATSSSPVQLFNVMESLAVLKAYPTLVMTGKTPDGEVIQIAALGGGYEVQIIPTAGPVKHRCFVTDDFVLAWFAVEYVLAGRV